MKFLKRLDERVFVDLFNKVSNGKCRIPFRVAVNELCKLFSRNGSSDTESGSEAFVNELFTRGVDKRAGLAAQVLLVGGPKNIRGNPRGGLDARLYFPQVTFEQFHRIALEMECIHIEKLIPHVSGAPISINYNTKQLKTKQERYNDEIIKQLQRHFDAN
ncbi:hypothetical protein BdWA1_000871 [Babesia duncani]|uniref:Uncharacterized protein n=1 Tax=Babesia duncani TaxID=323732 RepID=A0AAD9PN68_9APIC|nr:hypothetical protein BdWA1_000871 [Babesia duncani]